MITIEPESRQSGIEHLRARLRPANQELAPTTKAELAAHYAMCEAEYAPSGDTTRRIHRPFAGSPLAARAGRLG